MDTCIQTDAILLDSTKAFDEVPHMHLCCSKLSYYEIKALNGLRISWMGRIQQVIVEEYHSSPINV